MLHYFPKTFQKPKVRYELVTLESGFAEEGIELTQPENRRIRLFSPLCQGTPRIVEGQDERLEAILSPDWNQFSWPQAVDLKRHAPWT